METERKEPHLNLEKELTEGITLKLTLKKGKVFSNGQGKVKLPKIVPRQEKHCSSGLPTLYEEAG